ncbi:hypothetical protein C1W90_04790 [Burkholderia pseudomallei]|nr:hypothetical protein [Burkholderia pseudomallei]NAX99016.1 hypothetical protein [Burkholderia pseudomallei]NAY17649.1 hypothetical protein [Burkholderia pseudomallei]NAY24492.1 hypothetical protein [Burkholderia pseudomallei]NAY31423.1 hypothetical protein [Burkholderia pseudomallei]
MNMNGNGTDGAMGEAISSARGGRSMGAISELDINALRSGLEAFRPPKRYTVIEIVRELFPVLEAKRNEGASFEQLTDLLNKNRLEIAAQTLKTQMSIVRRELKVGRVKCPSCGTRVKELAVGGIADGDGAKR